MNSILSLKPCCHTSSLSRTRGSTFRRQSASTSRSTRNACHWKRKGGAKRSYSCCNLRSRSRAMDRLDKRVPARVFVTRNRQRVFVVAFCHGLAVDSKPDG
ncbi:hypothetical protein Cfor_00496, partial [Coptotermes formosanus]